MKNYVLAIALILSSPLALSATTQSRHLKLTSDTSVTTNSGLLTTSITLASPATVYLQADGRYYPGPPTAKTLASAYILVNGSLASNESFIDWRQSNAKQQHSFNVIGVAHLPAGTHSIGLYGVGVGSSVIFGKDTALSILVRPAGSAVQTKLPGDTTTLSFNTSGISTGMPLPSGTGRSTILSLPVSGSSPVIAMTSGRAYVNGSYGDAMIGLFANNSEPNIDSMTWSINDLYTGAETQAPMYSQAMFTTPGVHSVQLTASESPYAGNNVRYKIGAGTSLVVLSGAGSIAGKALTPGYPYSSNGQFNRFAYVCIGTNGFLPSCPPTGSEVVIGSGQVCIPSGHNGVVMFSAKTRVQADQADPGGTAYLYIKIDGSRVGSLGVQQLGPAPNAVSTRTLSASYLASGSKTLNQGCHTVQAIGLAQGNFRHLMMNADMPLIWFD